MSRYRNRSGHNYSQPAFRDDMDLWGEAKGDEVWEQEPHQSRLLGPDGKPLEYRREPLGFDLRPVRR